MANNQAPLSRFTVLDLTRVRAGPTAVRQLADWGANIIKIEPPESIDKAKTMGGPRHGPDFQNLHRNKRSMTLNLKADEGRDTFFRMVRQADVIVENFRPDVKDRLNIGYEVCKKKIPASYTPVSQDLDKTGPTDCDLASIKSHRAWVDSGGSRACPVMVPSV